MSNFSSFTSVFYMRKAEDLKTFYLRPDFWVSLVALLFVVLSFVLNRYESVNFTQLFKHTGANWAFAFLTIGTLVIATYVFVTNFLFRNTGVLSAINIGAGILLATFLVIEYILLKNVGIKYSSGVNTMSNDAAVGYYLALVGAVLIVGLEFYKLGVQGYYSKEDVINERKSNGVEIVDGVVVVDGEKVDTEIKESPTRIRVMAEENYEVKNNIEVSDDSVQDEEKK